MNGPASMLLAGVAAFATYFAMYAFRKPIAAGQFGGIDAGLLSLDFKTAVILTQAIGYALSKLIGVRFVAEGGRHRRGIVILALVLASWLALLGFAAAPPSLALLFAFLNGIPLGIIWGLVFSYLEGRRATEWMVAILTTSFIVSSGVVKTVGVYLLSLGVTERWMPFATGGLFLPLLLLSLLLLARTPPPDARDLRERTERTSMDADARRIFLRRHGLPIALLIFGYVLLAALRDFRDNFMAELLTETGLHGQALLFSATELPIAVGVLALMAAIGLVSDNMRALLTVHSVILVGAACLVLANLALASGWAGPILWMALVGFGIYIAYAPFGAILFDRLIAATGQPANAGFLIYLADASGYVASVGLLLVRAYASPDLAWLSFFVRATYIAAAGLSIATISSALIFLRWRKRTPDT